MTKTLQIELPVSDWSFLMDLAKVRGWKTKTKRTSKSGIEKGMEDIEKGNVFHATDADDLIRQCLS